MTDRAAHVSAPASATHHRAVSMLVLATFFWGLSFPLIKAIVRLQAIQVPAASSWFMATFAVAPRFVLGVLVIALLRPREVFRISPLEYKQGIIIGLFAAGGMLLQIDGLQFTSASTSAFLTQFYAILIPLWVALRTRRNPGALVFACCALVLAGVAILGRFDWHELKLGRGEWETLAATLFFTGQILWLEKKQFSANRADKITLVMFGTAAIVFLLLAGLSAPTLGAMLVPWASPSWLLLTGLLTAFCTVGSFSLMNAWQPKITATEAGLIYCIEPIFASAMALVLPAWFSHLAGIDYANERLTWSLLVGGGLITLANVLLQLKPPKKDCSAAPSCVADGR